MQKQKQQKEPEKQPIDMTTDELLNHVVDPKVADRLREFVRESDDHPKPLEKK